MPDEVPARPFVPGQAPQGRERAERLRLLAACEQEWTTAGLPARRIEDLGELLREHLEDVAVAGAREPALDGGDDAVFAETFAEEHQQAPAPVPGLSFRAPAARRGPAGTVLAAAAAVLVASHLFAGSRNAPVGPGTVLCVLLLVVFVRTGCLERLRGGRLGAALAGLALVCVVLLVLLPFPAVGVPWPVTAVLVVADLLLSSRTGRRGRAAPSGPAG